MSIVFGIFYGAVIGCLGADIRKAHGLLFGIFFVFVGLALYTIFLMSVNGDI